MPDSILPVIPSLESQKHFNVRHGHACNGVVSKTYKAWRGMISRCHNPKDKDFKDYGGRGIQVCSDWMDSFKSFLSGVGEAPVGMTIDRIDNSKNYEPGNVRWVSRREQNKNRRNTRVVTVRGFTGTIQEACNRFGTPYQLFWQRLSRGLDPETAMFREKSSRR